MLVLVCYDMRNSRKQTYPQHHQDVSGYGGQENLNHLGSCHFILCASRRDST